MPLIRNIVELDQWTFFENGLQYYLAGRGAFIDQLMPVAGNLFHHAIEMFLKSKMYPTLSLEELRNKPYSHNLISLWNKFRETNSDLLNNFNDLIISLNQWEDLRYPEKIDRDVSMHYQMNKNEKRLDFETTPELLNKKYHLCLEELDEFFKEIVINNFVRVDHITNFLKFGSGNRFVAYRLK